MQYRENTLKWLFAITLRRSLLFFTILIAATGTAQEQDTLTNAPAAAGTARSFSIGLSAGTHAIGSVDLTVQVFDRFNLKMGYSYLKFGVNSFRISSARLGFPDRTLLIDSDLSLNTFGLMGEFMPSARKKIRIVCGIMTGFDNSIEVSMRFRDAANLNDYTITPEQIGMLQATYSTQSSIYPYLGIGLWESISSKRISLSADIGAFFRGRPVIEVESDGLIANNEHLGPVLEESFKAWQWHPNISLRLAYNIHLGKGKEVPIGDGFYTDAELPKDPKKKQRSSRKKKVSSEEPPPADTSTTIEAVPEPQPVEEPEMNSDSPYISFVGTAINKSTAERLDYIYIHIYLRPESGPRELVRTGRFLNGQFNISLERGKSYEFNLEHHLFKKQMIQIDFSAPSPSEIKRTFELEPK